MQSITFRIKGKDIELVRVSGEAGSDKTRAIFQFDGGWTGRKVATFRNLQKEENVLLINDSCEAPQNIISAGRYSVKVTSNTRKTDFVIVG